MRFYFSFLLLYPPAPFFFLEKSHLIAIPSHPIPSTINLGRPRKKKKKQRAAVSIYFPFTCLWFQDPIAMDRSPSSMLFFLSWGLSSERILKKKKTKTIFFPSPPQRGLKKKKTHFCIFHNLVPPQFTLAIHAIDKTDRHLRHRAPHRLGPDHQLHLERIPLTLRAGNHLLQDRALIQAETARQVADPRAKDRVGEQIRAATHDLALQIPPVDARALAAGVSRAGDDVVVLALVPLGVDHRRDEFRVVAHVGVHDDDEVPSCEFEPVHVCRAQPQLARSWFQHDALRCVEGLQLLGDRQGAVRGGIVDDD